MPHFLPARCRFGEGRRQALSGYTQAGLLRIPALAGRAKADNLRPRTSRAAGSARDAVKGGVGVSLN